VLPRDLSAYRRGNTGIDYVHRFTSGRPGPHVLVNALTHGNELCGMVAATHLLDSGVRPRIGTLTVSFANVAAYESFDPARPADSRQLVHNMNRIWSDAWLDGDEDSPELRRARAMRPAVAAADHILDIHSVTADVPPFWVYPQSDSNAAAALAIGRPGVHLVMPQGLRSGTPLIQHGRHGSAGFHGVGLVVECGGDFLRRSADVATNAALDFLAHFGLIDRAEHAEGPNRAPQPQPRQQRFELIHVWVIKTPHFRFPVPLKGFETFARGELIAIDGGEEVRAPCDDCTVLMPATQTLPGREGIYLTRPLTRPLPPPLPPPRVT
jgi:predicted deacylase